MSADAAESSRCSYPEAGEINPGGEDSEGCDLPSWWLSLSGPRYLPTWPYFTLFFPGSPPAQKKLLVLGIFAVNLDEHTLYPFS